MAALSCSRAAWPRLQPSLAVRGLGNVAAAWRGATARLRSKRPAGAAVNEPKPRKTALPEVRAPALQVRRVPVPGKSLTQLHAEKGLAPIPAQKRCLERLETVRGEFAALAGMQSSGPSYAPRGVYIYGDPGSGKTMVMDMFHEALVSAGIPSRRVHMHDFMVDVDTRMHRVRKAQGNMRNPLAKVAQGFVQESPLLCFDECHMLNIGDAMIIRSFFEQFFAAGGTVVTTSNLAPEDLYSAGINRELFQPFIDGILRHCDPVRLESGFDFRSAKSQELAEADGPRALFWPLGQEAETNVLQALARVRGTSVEESVPVMVPGAFDRQLPCGRAWPKGVRAAHFSFKELCVDAVGTVDYVALSEAFDVLVLTDVPRFRSSDEDSARRFAALVDVLYDRQRRLLCTVDAPPRELFAGVKENYSGGTDDLPEGQEASAMRMPKHGGSSGKHVATFRLPEGLRYSEKGGYQRNGDDPEPSGESKSMAEEDLWVEWSATGLKDASMFDLTCRTKRQMHDRLLPILRCESRLEEMSYL